MFDSTEATMTDASKGAARTVANSVAEMAFARVPQHTLKNDIHCTGVGLHGGQRVRMTLRPAAPDSGIVLRRVDVGGDAALIPALYDHVGDTRLCTVLANRHGVKVGTVEHVMAALAGLGIDNAVIEVDGPELPIMDGSSAPFVFLIECAGIVEQDASRRAIRVLKPVHVTGEGGSASLFPAPAFEIDFTIDFPSRVIGRQSFRWRAAPGSFKTELSRARTFGFYREVEQMRQAGLGRGGSLENAIVVDGDRVMNPGGLRMADEFVRHKALDAVGDLALAGAYIVGRYVGEKSGHRLNNELLRALFADESAWMWVRAPREPATQAAAPAVVAAAARA
jgi:UDP-3-O-[3-hydroxymyristoyl] N-acetylglucosamine deacetylase